MIFINLANIRYKAWLQIFAWLDNGNFKIVELSPRSFGSLLTKSIKSNSMCKVFMICIAMFLSMATSAQDSTVVRIARLQIDSTRLELYKAILKEEIEAALRIEPGVLALYSVADKNNPNQITVFEIYASDSAYRSHILTPHFLKYKTSTKDMVLHLDLSEHQPVLLRTKQ